MTLNTINPGVDTNFSTKLNENFQYSIEYANSITTVPVLDNVSNLSCSASVGYDTDVLETKTGFTYVTGFSIYEISENSTGTLITSDISLYAPYLSYKGWAKWRIYKYTIIDEIDDSTVDTNLWESNGTLTEDGSRLTTTVTDKSIATKSGSDGDFYGTNDQVYIQYGHAAPNSGNKYKVYITDGTNYVQLFEQQVNDTGLVLRTLLLKFNATNSTVSIGGLGTTYGSPIDISSLSGRWSIYFINSLSNVQIYIYSLRKFTNSESSSVVESLSFDGTNYNTLTGGYAETSTNKGMVGKLKLEATTEAGEGIMVFGHIYSIPNLY